MVVGIIATANVWLAKVFTPDFKIPDTEVEEMSDFVRNKIPATNTAEEESVYEEGVVVAVLDGDTIEVVINGNVKRVRYIGIDTPEKVGDKNVPECFAAEATQKNEALVLGQIVHLIKDVSEVDRYERLLRYVYVGEDFINLRLVAEGYARAVMYPPDVAMSDELKKAEAVAQNTEIGLWSVCKR